MWDFIVRVMYERKCEDSRQIKDQRSFRGSLREAFLRSEACAQHMTRMQRVMIDGDSWFSQVSRE